MIKVSFIFVRYLDMNVKIYLIGESLLSDRFTSLE